MKNIKYFFLILLSVGTLNSCNSILDEEIYNFKPKEEFYLSSSDAESAIKGTYSHLANIYSKVLIEMTLEMTGAFGKSGQTNEFISATMNSSSKDVALAWELSYKLINSCNDVIYNVSKMDTLKIKEAHKNMIIGEARFLRSWSYFNLVRMYGKIPVKLLPTEDLESETIMNGLTPVNDVYRDVIIPDFEFAENHCPETYASVLAGRVTKYAASAALAKVYITIASMIDNPDPKEEGFDYPDFVSSECWAKARDEAKLVIDNSGASLVTDFADLWKTDTKNPSESIFEVQFYRGVVGGSSLAKIFTPNNSHLAARGGGWGRATCTMKNYNDFYMAYEPDTNTGNDTIDYRIEKTYITSYVKFDKETGVPLSIEHTYPLVDEKGKPYKTKETYVGKWIDPKAPDNGAGNNNFIVIRLADVYLMYAEAMNETGGANPELYVNKILERARHADGTERVQPEDWTAGLSQADLREKIWNERRFELSAELHLWFDLVRRGKSFFINFKKADNAFVDDIYGVKDNLHVVLDRNILYPIPLIEISANDKIQLSDQNSGY